MKIGFPFIVVKGACHSHAVPFHKFRSKIFQQRIMIVMDQTRRQHDDQFPGLNTFPFRSASGKIRLILL